MSSAAELLVLSFFLVFCRIGACLMSMPGFSSQHVPVKVRLLMALGVSLALTPYLGPTISRQIDLASSQSMTLLIVSECTVGFLIGFLGRIFFIALEFIGTAIATMAGFSGLPGATVEESEPVPTLASMLTVTATLLVFLSGLHLEVIRALLNSYNVIGIHTVFDVSASMLHISQVIEQTFRLSVQIAAPFFVFAVVVNFMFGLANKLIPQMPIYFISAPFMILGALAMLYLIGSEMLLIFLQVFRTWLETGAA